MEAILRPTSDGGSRSRHESGSHAARSDDEDARRVGAMCARPDGAWTCRAAIDAGDMSACKVAALPTIALRSSAHGLNAGRTRSRFAPAAENRRMRRGLRSLCVAAFLVITSALALLAPHSAAAQSDTPAGEQPRWERLAAAWQAEQPPESDLWLRARARAVRESLVDELSTLLAEQGLPTEARSTSDPAAAKWLYQRILDAVMDDDPRFHAFLERLDAPERARAWDPEGNWTLPATLSLASRNNASAAARWSMHAICPSIDEPFVLTLQVEALLAAGDTTGAATVASERSSAREWPSWTAERLLEARILGALVDARTKDARGLLAQYRSRFAPGPWTLSTQARIERMSGNRARSDSLARELATQYPSNGRARSLLQAWVPSGTSPGSPALAQRSDAELRALAVVAEAQVDFDRYLTLSRELAARGVGDPASFAHTGVRVGYKAKRYKDVIAEIDAGHWTPNEQSADWGLVLGRLYRNSGQLESMERWYGRALRFGTVSEQEDALWEWGRELESLRSFARADSVYGALAARNTAKRIDALYRQSFCRIQDGRGGAAEPLLQEVATSGDGENRAAAHFWLARVAFQRGDMAAGKSQLQRAAEEEAYYGRRAATALQAAANGGPAIDDVAGYWRWFREVGGEPDLYTTTTSPDMDEARPWHEENHGLPASLNRAAAHLLLCRQYGRNTWAERALSALDNEPSLGDGDTRIARLHSLGLPDLATRRAVRESRPGLVRRYPAPFGDAVAWASLEWSVAPEWMWSIMRRESFFERTVRSGAGAIGLMQFMPKTASEVASRHGLAASPLGSPWVNLQLGAAHFAEMEAEYEGRWPILLAAYNAGPDPAERWVHPEDDLDEYIEQIGYRETRDYVKAVLHGFWVYRQRLRGERVPGFETGEKP